jgi:hypothetical protein
MLSPKGWEKYGEGKNRKSVGNTLENNEVGLPPGSEGERAQAEKREKPTEPF